MPIILCMTLNLIQTWCFDNYYSLVSPKSYVTVRYPCVSESPFCSCRGLKKLVHQSFDLLWGCNSWARFIRFSSNAKNITCTVTIWHLFSHAFKHFFTLMPVIIFLSYFLEPWKWSVLIFFQVCACWTKVSKQKGCLKHWATSSGSTLFII